ncbi:MAG: aldo/keto reductase [Clostridiales Family XIII bacterium]|nr:aldo/keto reductase [Clostridiales Family XIII bacterium]
MKYRTFPKTGEQISLLGFGCMRLPETGGENPRIDEEEAIRMIRYAIDNGVNYVDTAYMYHDGKSEVVVGKALKDGYREKVLLADKLPVVFIKEEADQQKFLDEQLRRLEVSTIDMYLVHNINEAYWEKVKKYDTLRFMKEKQEEGIVKHVGFSFHGETPEFFREVTDAFPWDFCQIQLNYMDTELQAGVEGLKYAGSKGIPVIVMEPLKGGKLTDVLPASVRAYWDGIAEKRTPADWALKWVANFPEVLTILSGMSNFEQTKENIRILSDADANALTQEELDVIERVAAEYNKLIPYSCTVCKYCMPCPVQLDIPYLISLRNEATIFESPEKISETVKSFVRPLPSTCIACKQCEEKCPQHLPISDIMAESARMFE